MTSPSLRRIILLPRAPATGAASERKGGNFDPTPGSGDSHGPGAANVPDESLIIDNVSVPRSLDPRMMSDGGSLPGANRKLWAVGRTALRVAIVLVAVCITVPRIPRISVVVAPPPTNDPGAESVGSAAANSVDPTPQAASSEAPPSAPGERNRAGSTLSPPDRLQEGEIIRQLMRGQELLGRGEIAAARSLFQRVADAGEARGALALAETYEPSATVRLRVNSLAPNLELARKWYQKAESLGSAEAERRLQALANHNR